MTGSAKLRVCLPLQQDPFPLSCSDVPGEYESVLNAIIDWSLQSLFDRTINRACPVARSSKVRVELPDGSSPYAITPEPGAVEGGVATYTIDASEYYFTFTWMLCS